MRFFMRDREHRAQHDMIATAQRCSHRFRSVPASSSGSLSRGKSSISTPNSCLFRSCARWNSLPDTNLNRSHAFEIEEQHHLAAVSCLVERTLPSLACCDSSTRVEVEEILVSSRPSRSSPVARISDQPSAVVCARMAQKNARHDNHPWTALAAPRQALKMLAAIVMMQTAASNPECIEKERRRHH